MSIYFCWLQRPCSAWIFKRLLSVYRDTKAGLSLTVQLGSTLCMNYSSIQIANILPWPMATFFFTIWNVIFCHFKFCHDRRNHLSSAHGKKNKAWGEKVAFKNQSSHTFDPPLLTAQSVSQSPRAYLCRLNQKTFFFKCIIRCKPKSIIGQVLTGNSSLCIEIGRVGRGVGHKFD